MLKHFQHTLLLSVFCLSNAFGYYSKPHDEKLDKLVSIKPHETFVSSKTLLSQSSTSNNIQSQLKALYYIAQSLSILNKLEEQQKYVNDGLKLSRNHNISSYECEFLIFQASYLDIKGKYSQAFKKINKALELAKTLKDDRLIARTITTRAQTYLNMDHYDLALKDIELSTDLYKKNNDRIRLSQNYNLLAITYDAMGDYKKALNYYQESVNFDDIKSPYNLSAIYYNIGSTYSSLDNHDKAMEYYLKSRKHSKDSNNLYSLAFTDYGIAELLIIKNKNLEEAEKILKSTIDVFNKNNDKVMVLNSYLILMDASLLKNNLEQARKYLITSEKIAKKLNVPSYNLHILKQKIALSEANKDWEGAFKFQSLAYKLIDEIEKNNKENSIEELKIKFNSKFDNEKMELLTKQNELQQAVIEKEKSKQKYFWAATVFGLMLLLVIYRAYKNQITAKKNLFHLTITDHLTQVSNRRHILELVKKLYLQKQNFALIMIDLDYFKKINDNYGHDIGNEVLIHFAKSTRNNLPEHASIGRIGGEEWLIILRDVDKNTVKSFLKNLRDTYISARPHKIPKECELSFSSGIALNSNQFDSHEQLLKEADLAMYQAKAQGREQDIFV